MTKPIIITLEGQMYIMERIKIEDLADWRQRHNLEPVGPAHLAEEKDSWPPIVLYRKRRP